MSSREEDWRVTHTHRSNLRVCVGRHVRAHTPLRATEHCGDSDGLWRGQGSGEGARSELEQGTGGQHREAVAVGGSSQSRVDRRVTWDNEPKGNEV